MDLRRKMKPMTNVMPRTSRALAIIDKSGRGNPLPARAPGGVPPVLLVTGTADGVAVGNWSVPVAVGSAVAVPVTCGVAVLPGVGVLPGPQRKMKEEKKLVAVVSPCDGVVLGVGVGEGVGEGVGVGV